MGQKKRMFRVIPIVVSVIFILACVYAAEGKEKGLLGYWKFDEAGGDEARDSSGMGNNGEIYGAEWVKGKFGTALYFKGHDAYVSIPEIEGLNGSDELTVEAWVFWEKTGRYPNIVTGGRWNPGGFLMFVADNSCSFRLGKPGEAPWEVGKDWAEVSAPFLDFSFGQWYHLAVTFKRPFIQTYVNGKPVGSANWDYPIGYSGEVQIGTWGNPKICHSGLIDEVKIYNRALSAEEVKASYEREAGKRIGAVRPGEKPYEKVTEKAKLRKPAIKLENQFLKILIDENARLLGLIDKATGRDFCARPSFFATVKKDKKIYKPSACSYRAGKLTLEFGESGVKAIIKVGLKRHYFVFEVASVSGQGLEELTFLNLSVKPSKYVSSMSGMAADDEFAVCLRAVNLQVYVSVGGEPPVLRATCYPKYGLVGAGAALVGCPKKKLRSVLKEVVRKEGLPYSPLGGPFALDAPDNKLSYVFASVSEQNVDDWIKLAKKSGISIIHLSGWERSLGHYEPRPDLFPNGLAGLKRVIDKIHAASLKAGMHILTGCISPHDPFVTPVPDKRLAKDATFTLSEAVGETDKAIHTAERPQGLDIIWAYASTGNVVQIDDELIQYTGLSQEPPYGFTGCIRGAFGTKSQPHKQGSPVYHLFVRYTSFLPDENSTLVDEIAGCIARVFNECNFDLIYMDGAEGMPGGWYGVSKMRAAIFKRLKKPLRVEASEWGYHSWPFHSCIGAWDHPCWGLKRFIDLHCQQLKEYQNSHLLPGQLGWWAILGPSEDYYAELPDEIEYLCCKALGYDVPMSFQGVHPSAQAWNARQDEYLALIGRYERLRLGKYFPESVRARLRRPNEEFRLLQAPDGTWQFIPTDYATHKVTGLKDGSNIWTVYNRFNRQPLKLRIQALYSAAPYDSSDSLILADFSRQDEFTVSGAADGVIATWTPSREQVQQATVSGCYSARNNTAERRGAWARISKIFSPPIDIRRCGALGVWIYGDGKGEILNFQLTNPPQYWNTFDEHYVTIDFTGWRYFELHLRERDAERHGDYAWPYNDIYGVYRSPLIRHSLNGLNIYYNNLPPGEEVKCYISPIKALPVAKVKLVNPAVTVGDSKIVFPVSLESGQYIEFESPLECKLYDERSALLQRITPEGEAPLLTSDENQVVFLCDGPEGHNARANVTVITQGKPLPGSALRRD